MDENFAIPVERIIDAPRLSAIGTTVDEMKAAVESESNILVHFVGKDGKSYLRRTDGCKLVVVLRVCGEFPLSWLIVYALFRPGRKYTTTE